MTARARRLLGSAALLAGAAIASACSTARPPPPDTLGTNGKSPSNGERAGVSAAGGAPAVDAPNVALSGDAGACASCLSTTCGAAEAECVAAAACTDCYGGKFTLGCFDVAPFEAIARCMCQCAACAAECRTLTGLRCLRTTCRADYEECGRTATCQRCLTSSAPDSCLSDALAQRVYSCADGCGL